MGDVYSSALGTTVVRHRRVPARPAHLDGRVAVLVEAGGVLDGAGGESELKRALGLSDDEGATFEEEARWLVRFTSHERAEAAVAGVGKVAGAAAIFTFYNSRSYDERGWTTFESAVSTEVLARAAYYKGLRACLAQLPPKLVEIDGEEPREAEEAAGGPTDKGMGPSNERARARILAASFTSNGDKGVVLGLHSEYITSINNAMASSGGGGKGGGGVYEGEHNWAGQMEGRGTLRLASGDVYEGEWKADKKEGRGTIWLVGGDMYEGEYKAGKEEGHGTCRYADGDVYEGEWKAGKMEGRGTCRFANGAVYEGEWTGSKKEGRGTYRFARDAVYEGEWRAGQQEGRGSYRSSGGDVYEGAWKAGKKEGRGTYRYARSGDVYEGEWKAHKKEGRGTYTHADGEVEVGFYKQDIDAGEGVRWSADGLQVWRLRDGKVVAAISPEEAWQTAQRFSLPIPGTVAGVLAAAAALSA